MKRLLIILPVLLLLVGCAGQKQGKLQGVEKQEGPAGDHGFAKEIDWPPKKRSIESISANTGAAMSSYPTASSVVAGDKALISKSTASNATQQAAMSTIKDYVLSDVIDFSATSPLNFNSTTGVLSLTPWVSQSALEAWLGWTISDSAKSPKTVSKVTSTDYTIGTTSANELLSGIIVVTDSATITAPAVAVGHTYIVITRGDVAVSLDVDASDVMTLDGTALSAGDKATNTSKSGDTIACAYVAANDLQCWSATKLGGHWTDGN